MKYRKRSLVIEAVKWNGMNKSEIEQFAGDNVKIEVIRESNAEYGIPPQIDCTIKTLEGDMMASPGDYIIKGVKGEFYPCKPDIFEKTYDEADSSLSISFGDAIEVLKQGGAIRRKGWNGKGLFVIKQVPAHIESDIIPKMQSLPQSAKNLIMKIPDVLTHGYRLSVMYLPKIGRLLNNFLGATISNYYGSQKT